MARSKFRRAEATTRLSTGLPVIFASAMASAPGRHARNWRSFRPSKPTASNIAMPRSTSRAAVTCHTAAGDQGAGVATSQTLPMRKSLRKAAKSGRSSRLSFITNRASRGPRPKEPSPEKKPAKNSAARRDRSSWAAAQHLRRRLGLDRGVRPLVGQQATQAGRVRAATSRTGVRPRARRPHARLRIPPASDREADARRASRSGPCTRPCLRSSTEPAVEIRLGPGVQADGRARAADGS